MKCAPDNPNAVFFVIDGLRCIGSNHRCRMPIIEDDAIWCGSTTAPDMDSLYYTDFDDEEDDPVDHT